VNMNELGKAHVAGQERMARVLDARRQSRGMQSLLHKLLGLDAKMRQYEVGEAFVAAIEHEAGPRALDPAWRGPEWLPTVTAWMRRNPPTIKASRTTTRTTSHGSS